jgi:hypothetical protein
LDYSSAVKMEAIYEKSVDSIWLHGVMSQKTELFITLVDDRK